MILEFPFSLKRLELNLSFTYVDTVVVVSKLVCMV